MLDSKATLTVYVYIIYGWYQRKAFKTVSKAIFTGGEGHYVPPTLIYNSEHLFFCIASVITDSEESSFVFSS